MALKQIAEEYFGELNSIARRMYCDMEKTKQAYEALWHTISEKDQSDILSESIITPQVLLNYKQNETKLDSVKYATKLIIDENSSFTDEHSGPFSFKTKSQRNLSLFSEDNKPECNAPTKLKIKNTAQTRSQEDLPVSFHMNENKQVPKTGLDFLDNW